MSYFLCLAKNLLSINPTQIHWIKTPVLLFQGPAFALSWIQVHVTLLLTLILCIMTNNFPGTLAKSNIFTDSMHERHIFLINILLLLKWLCIICWYLSMGIERLSFQLVNKVTLCQNVKPLFINFFIWWRNIFKDAYRKSNGLTCRSLYFLFWQYLRYLSSY